MISEAPPELTLDYLEYLSSALAPRIERPLFQFVDKKELPDGTIWSAYVHEAKGIRHWKVKTQNGDNQKITFFKDTDIINEIAVVIDQGTFACLRQQFNGKITHELNTLLIWPNGDIHLFTEYTHFRNAQDPDFISLAGSFRYIKDFAESLK